MPIVSGTMCAKYLTNSYIIYSHISIDNVIVGALSMHNPRSVTMCVC